MNKRLQDQIPCPFFITIYSIKNGTIYVTGAIYHRFRKRFIRKVLETLAGDIYGFHRGSTFRKTWDVPSISVRSITNYLSHTVNEIISDDVTYEEAIDVLNATYIKPKNEIFYRHLLATRWQESGETLDHFCKSLWTLCKDY